MPDQAFPTTQCTVILFTAENPDNSIVLRKASENLCLRYWRPLYVYARSCGKQAEDSEDLVQGFFAHLLEGDRYLIADPKIGKFRTFLLTSFKRFMTEEWRKEKAWKRGGREKFVSIDFTSAEKAVQPEGAEREAEEEFDRAWAKTIIKESLVTLDKKHTGGKREELYLALKPFLTLESEGSVQEVADRLGRKPGTVRVTLGRLREDYRKIIRKTVSDTLTPESDLEEEIRYLIGLLLRK